MNYLSSDIVLPENAKKMLVKSKIIVSRDTNREMTNKFPKRSD